MGGNGGKRVFQPLAPDERQRWQGELGPKVWKHTREDFHHPSLEEPIFRGKVEGGASLDFITRKITVGSETIERLNQLGGLDIGRALSGIETHEVGHYMGFPRDIATFFAVAYLIDTQFRDVDTSVRKFMHQAFMDLGNDTLSAVDERKAGQILDTRRALQETSETPVGHCIRELMLAYLYHQARMPEERDAAVARTSEYLSNPQRYFDELMRIDFTGCSEAFSGFRDQAHAMVPLRLAVHYFGNVVLGIEREISVGSALRDLMKKLNENLEGAEGKPDSEPQQAPPEPGKGQPGQEQNAGQGPQRQTTIPEQLRRIRELLQEINDILTRENEPPGQTTGNTSDGSSTTQTAGDTAGQKADGAICQADSRLTDQAGGPREEANTGDDKAGENSEEGEEAKPIDPKQEIREIKRLIEEIQKQLAGRKERTDGENEDTDEDASVVGEDPNAGGQGTGDGTESDDQTQTGGKGQVGGTKPGGNRQSKPGSGNNPAPGSQAPKPGSGSRQTSDPHANQLKNLGDQLEQIKDVLQGKQRRLPGSGASKGNGSAGDGTGSGLGGGKGDCDPSEQLKNMVPRDLEDLRKEISRQMGKQEFDRFIEWLREQLKNNGLSDAGTGIRGSAGRGIGIGTSDGELRVDPGVVDYYLTLSKAYAIPIVRVIMPTKSRVPVKSASRVWKPSDPAVELQLIPSGGRILPGITRTTATKSKKVRKRAHDTPYVLIVIDSSGSMPDPATYKNHAVLAGFCVARSYHTQGACVGVVNFSGRSFFLPYTRVLYDALGAIAAYQGGGTVIDIELVARMLGPEAARLVREHPDLILSRPGFDHERFVKKEVDVGLTEEIFREGKIDIVMFTDGGIFNLDEMLKFLDESAQLHRATIINAHKMVKLKEFETKKITIFDVDDTRDIPGIVIGQTRKNFNRMDLAREL